MAYSYITGNNLESRQYYNYSSYQGVTFLDDYLKTREEILNKIDLQILFSENELKKWQNTLSDSVSFVYYLLNDFGKNTKLQNSKNYFDKENEKPFNTNEQLYQLLAVFLLDSPEKQLTLYKELSKFVKSFEVHKRVFDDYDLNFKPLNLENYKNFLNYGMLSILVGLFFLEERNLKFLNALLKLNDTLISISNFPLTIQERKLIYLSVSLEMRAINLILRENNFKSIF